MATCTIPDIADKNTTGDTLYGGRICTKPSSIGHGPRTGSTPNTGSTDLVSTMSVIPIFRLPAPCRQFGC